MKSILKCICSLLVPIVASLAILTGCGASNIEKSDLVQKTAANENSVSNEITKEEPSTSTTSETNITSEISLTLYLFDENDYEKVKEKKVFQVSKEEYEDNRVGIMNDMFKEVGIRFNRVSFDPKTSTITADIPKDVEEKFDQGSCAGSVLTNGLVTTMLNMPDVQKAVITVDGEKDRFGNHYSFEGVFEKDGETKFMRSGE